MYDIVILFANGSVDSMFRPSFHEARKLEGLLEGA